MNKSKETRFAEVKTSGVNDLVLVGNPVVYDTPTTINLEGGGSYTEIIHRGALDACDLNDSTLKVNHADQMIPLARTPKTMQLTVTDSGLYMRAELAGDSAQAREVYTSVRRGDLTGMSFAFVVAEGGSSYDPTTNTRHINAIDRVLEVSIVERPAYATASVEARDAITAARDVARTQAQNRAKRIEALARAKRIINREIG